MLSDKDFATKVLAETAECLGRLNALLLEAQETVPTDEFNQLRRGIGMVLGYMYTDVDRPIHKMHPDLEPEETLLPQLKNEQLLILTTDPSSPR